MIKCTKFRAYEKNTLRAFVSLELSRVGLVLHDCTWHVKDGAEWVGFPAKSFEGKDGTKWVPLVEFAADAGEARKTFQQQALTAIHAAAAVESASDKPTGRPADNDLNDDLSF